MTALRDVKGLPDNYWAAAIIFPSITAAAELS